jgi:dienelactone hydrolase
VIAGGTPIPTGPLGGWSQGTYTYDGKRRDVFRRGDGPGVVVIHEIPGITPKVAAFGQRVVDAGFTVVMPSLFGRPSRERSAASMATTLTSACVSREFAAFARNTTSPVTVWLRALARDLHEELGGPGVGAIGMCLTGGFALAMMVDSHTVAPVLSQPSLPFGVTARHRRDLNLSPGDLATVKQRAAEGCEVLGLRFAADGLSPPERFARLREELGERFICVEFPSTSKRDHSVLTEEWQEAGVVRVLDFLAAKLRPGVEPG